MRNRTKEVSKVLKVLKSYYRTPRTFGTPRGLRIGTFWVLLVWVLRVVQVPKVLLLTHVFSHAVPPVLDLHHWTLL